MHVPAPRAAVANLERTFLYNHADAIAAIDLRIPTMPISRSSGSRSVIPIDPDQCGVA